MDWSKAAKIGILVRDLANKHPDKIPMSDIYSIDAAIETQNTQQFIQHLYWVLRAIHVYELQNEEESQKIFELARQVADEP